MTRRLRAGLVGVALGLAACATPPSKEMDQAQGGIDAARAAGADRYAVSEYTAATDALKRAQEAVAQRDYRLALNEALDSREHAQNAAREAADTKAQLRGDVEREMAELAGLIAAVNTRLTAASRSRTPPRLLETSRGSLAALDESVQKAGASLREGDYLAAQAALQGVKDRLQKILDALPDAPTQSSRRAR